MKLFFQKSRNFNIVPCLIIYYTVGLIGLLLPQTHNLFKTLIPFNLLLNLFLLLIYHGRIDFGFIWKSLIIFVAGIFVEVIGVNTGLIFGLYEYGPTLGIKIFHTPLLIGINWLMLVYGSLVITSKFLDKRYFRAIIAAALMVVFDFALEPSAIKLMMWDWGGAVPLQNYVAWFFVSYILIWFADWSGMVNKQNNIAAPLFFIQMLFFIFLDTWMFIKNLWEF